MNVNEKHTILVTDLMANKHLLLSGAELELIESALILAAGKFHEMGSDLLRQDYINVWGKIFDFRKECNESV